ncbi:protein kinase family protein [Nocardia sp. CDC159]|uniref:Protein kinase family protein n=1 Tax=Nocardia pulmonis TaxID=2951408 RepID=A0A9X2E7G8_9NOCA|nr:MULTISPECIES: protein kinase family protein [Nocardia]MCM6773086.1 protein kinase family protein [Nocardia pulmonis]MCM6785611.1 protein kinase family protein [Nocardia sp. CDC159]
MRNRQAISRDAAAPRDMSRPARLHAYGAVSTALALHSDHALRELVDAAAPIGAGIGGKSALLAVAGTPVFVKRVPLTDLERQHEHVRSTANLFDMPLFYHYGVGLIGGAGFGAWRELAVHTITTNWVLAAEYERFPLMYHWRVLPDRTPLPAELADIDRAVAYWDGRPQVRHRIEALRDSSASIALFLEYIPQNLHEWLNVQIEAGGQAADRACAMVERELAAGTAFMNSHGLLHLDAHFENILTDGRRLYFGDYGLALSAGFDLSPAEAAFFDRNQSYDRGYTATYLVNWLLTALYGLEGRQTRAAMVRAIAEGKPPGGIPEGAAAALIRHAPVAAAMSEFMRAFQQTSRSTPYPDEEIRRLLDGQASVFVQPV